MDSTYLADWMETFKTDAGAAEMPRDVHGPKLMEDTNVLFQLLYMMLCSGAVKRMESYFGDIDGRASSALELSQDESHVFSLP
jgi:hypothetical protein